MVNLVVFILILSLYIFIIISYHYTQIFCITKIVCIRFVPRHDDELELEVDDPLLVEVQAEDYWYEGYNMRTGARGIFPAYYAVEVTKDTESYKGSDTPMIIKCRRLTRSVK